jgi:hypothetical protein
MSDDSKLWTKLLQAIVKGNLGIEPCVEVMADLLRAVAARSA